MLPRKYDSDKVENYEIGYQTTTAGGRLFFSIVGYHMIWDDIQVQVNDPQPLVFQLGVVNFPEATIDGVEVQGSWVPAPGWVIDATLAWNDAEISESATLFPDTGADVEAVDGTRLPITPDWKGSLSVERTFDGTTLFGGIPFVRADYSYTGESINALEGLEATVVSPPPTIQDSYNLLDLRCLYRQRVRRGRRAVHQQPLCIAPRDRHAAADLRHQLPSQLPLSGDDGRKRSRARARLFFVPAACSDSPMRDTMPTSPPR
ncbi:MAG: TonB-dependent receptor [Gammaproteobacteria bacterium]